MNFDMSNKTKKILISFLVFAITFVNYGLPLKVIASESNSIFKFNLFHKNEIELNAYFDEEEKEKFLNVNDTAKLIVDVAPQVAGYLESGNLKLNLKNGNKNNFKIQSVTTDENIEAELELFKETVKLDGTDTIFSKENSTRLLNDSMANDETVKSLENVLNLENEQLKIDESIDDSKEIECYEVKLISENEILLQNIVKDTKLYIEIAYKQNEENISKVNVEDLYSNLIVTLEGDYVNGELEKVIVFDEKEVTIGWEYSKDIEVTSDYTKVSPFTVGDNIGTIVENIVTVKRNIEDEKFLPIKETNIKIEIPKINNKLPMAINVAANKLMATLGEEIVGVEAIKDKCSFDEETGILEIKISNTNLLAGKGEDTFNIICRYEDYIKDETITLNRNVLVTVEEFSSNSNKIQEKSITKEQEIKVKQGELISYFTPVSEEKINKGKINANYYVENKYETEFSNIVNLNVLTSDILEEIVIYSSEEFYKDKNGNILDATGDIKYKGINFKSSEIQEMLDKGSTIDLLDQEDNVFHTISKENNNSSIVFSENINTVKVRINKVQINGNIQIEFIKSIESTKYSSTEFNTIAKLINKVKANVKYVGLDEVFALSEIEIQKDFSETYTIANLSIDREYLSTVAENENVELKIELNNYLDTSDIYKNPSFEIVFPSFIKEIKLNNIYTLYQSGLSIRDYQVINENGINRLIINFDGTQNSFVSSNITNGTNIIVNANLVVDEITPRKQDEVKLYYFNEAATNYQTKANWNLSKEIPDGIINVENGYDSAVFEYQAPTGLIAINSIMNYDGTGKTIKSIRQGEITCKIPIQVEAQNSTMELAVLNNTGNECIETVLIGRVPFKGNKDVETNIDLGTNIDTVMKSQIIPDSNNANLSTIYYSTNPNADKDLDNESNLWTTECENPEEIKSYMILLDGPIAAGEILKYRYDFEIPENLGFDVKILGSFGAFYSNKGENLIVYESSIADKVGLVTDVGPKLEATMSVDIGEGTEIQEAQRMKYTVTINNVGSITAEDLVIKAKRPDYTSVVKKGKPDSGDYGFIIDKANNKDEFDIKIGTLNAGESNSVSYYVETGYIPTLSGYAHGEDENGYYRYVKNETGTEKQYITEVPPIFITNQATVTSSLLTEPIKTNEIKNELKEANFESDIRVDYDREVKVGMETNFTFILKNLSGKDLTNVTATLNLGDIYAYQEGKINEQEGEITFDETSGKVTYNIGKLPIDKQVILTAKVIAKQIDIGEKTVDCYFNVASNELEDYKSTVIPQTVQKAILEAKDISILLPETINENEQIVISTQIDNIGALECLDGVFAATVSPELIIEKIVTSDGMYLSNGNGTGSISSELPLINPNESMTVDMFLRAKNTEGSEAKVVNITRTIKNLDQADVILEPVKITILNTEKTEEEIEQERVDKLKQEYEEQKRQEEEAKKEEAAKREEAEKENAKNEEAEKENINVNNPSDNQSNDNNINNEEPNNDAIQNDNEEKEEQDIEQEPEEIITEKYSISGSAWLDTNKNGTRDNEDKNLSGVKVYLLTLDNKMLKSTITNSSGKYQFNQIENGQYVLAVEFDEDKYVVTTYRKNGVPEEQNSDVIENDSDNFSALTNELIVSNGNVEYIDIGLQNKDNFDLIVNKYISKIRVKTEKRDETYEFDNLETAKVEIKAKEIKGAQVDLEYTIVLENIGNVSGYAEQLVDFVDKDLKFEAEKNSQWTMGNDGYAYVKNINKVLLNKGDKKEFKLVLTKIMNEDNVGTVPNKVSILKAYNTNDTIENSNNNTSVQNTVILISTGTTAKIISAIVLVILITIVTYVINNKRRIKNDDFKVKINTKKVYK